MGGGKVRDIHIRGKDQYIRDWKAPEWHQKKHIRNLRDEWYDILAEEGFYDIEGGVEGHLLKGPTPSRRFHSVKSQVGTSDDKLDVHQVISDEEEVINYHDSYKASYYFHAQLLVCQAFRAGMQEERCWIWMLHSQGLGERAIHHELGHARSRVRRHLKVLKDTIAPHLTHATKRGKVHEL